MRNGKYDVCVKLAPICGMSVDQTQKSVALEVSRREDYSRYVIQFGTCSVGAYSQRIFQSGDSLRHYGRSVSTVKKHSSQVTHLGTIAYSQ